MALVLVGLIAGCASALMFVSIISHELVSLVLIILAPTPLMVAGLAWGPFCAAIGGLTAMIGLSAVFGLPISIGYGLAIVLPAWWLGHLVLLGRPRMSNGVPTEPELEWYPIGRILLWIAGLVVLISMATLLTFGTDATTINEALRQRLAQLLQLMSGSVVSANDPGVQSLVGFMPAMIAMSSMTTLTLNLWLAAKAVATSGRLRRPWPDLRTTALPPMTLVALCVALAFCFSDEMVGMIAKVVSGALLTAYMLTGFAVLHILTRGSKSRAFWLGTAYAMVVILGVWPVIAMMMLGLADAVFGFRERFLRNQPPPLSTP